VNYSKAFVTNQPLHKIAVAEVMKLPCVRILILDLDRSVPYYGCQSKEVSA